MTFPVRPPAESVLQFDQWAEAVFEGSSLGMLRVSPDYKVIAANRKAREIFGLPTLEGLAVIDLVADPKGADRLRHQAQQRLRGLSSEYEIEGLHFPDRRRVPLKVSGMPIVSSTGDVLGSLAIFRSLEQERRIQAFEEAIHSAQGVVGILSAVSDQIHAFMDFNFCAFNIYSKTGRHSRMLWTYDPEGVAKASRRWYPISEALAKWTQRHEFQSLLIADLVHRYPELEHEPTTRKFLESGYVGLVRFPVVLEGRVVASFNCASRNQGGFQETHIEQLRALPIPEACLMAVRSLENEELLFRSNLIREMFVCRTPNKIASAAVRSLAAQYGWESVEMYSIVEANQRIILLSQSNASPEYLLDESYSQPIAKGVLGYVAQHDCDVRIDDITLDSRYKDVYLQLTRATRSELCMPIRVNGRISALLNVEDHLENAFSEDEQENLRSLLDEIGGLFGAAWNEALISSAFESTPSAVLIADVAGNIIQYNSAAVAILEVTPNELEGKPLREYFEQPEIADDLFKSSQVAGMETKLKRKNGELVPVLLGSRELEAFGAWVISARDLSYQKRIAELESLRHMYREIAAQTKTPLSLVSSWLQRLQRKKGAIGTEVAQVAQKSLAQLKTVNLTYERLALYSQDNGLTGYNEILLNAGHLITRILDSFPAGLVSPKGLDRDDIYVRGDAFEIAFAIESIISFLLRSLPEDDQVQLTVLSTEGRWVIQIEAPFPTAPKNCEPVEVPPEIVCQTVREIALGREIIERFMQHHHGGYRQQELENGGMRFQLDFPAAAVEV